MASNPRLRAAAVVAGIRTCWSRRDHRRRRIEEALAPLRGRLPEPQLHRLALAIRSAVGIEALVWLTDVAGISREEAVEIMRWSASAWRRSALEESDAERATSAG